MLDTEAAETLMSLSAPDEHKFISPLYQEEGLRWHSNHNGPSSGSKKRSFHSFNLSPSSHHGNHSLPSTKGGAFMTSTRSNDVLPLLHRKLYEPMDDHPSVAMAMEDEVEAEEVEENEVETRPSWSSRSPFDGLVAVATSNQEENETYASSRPISIPSNRKHHHKWSLSRVKEDASFIGRDCSPTGVEDERLWSDTTPLLSSEDHFPPQRVRLSSICSSESGLSDYGGLGRKHLEEFIRMEISEVEQDLYEDHPLESMHSPQRPSFGESELKYVGSYSPEARKQRIERFLEKRKKRVWSKKVDYDVRKNFANSRLRVKGRFVKKEDEELLCQLLSYT